jgi:transmembrane sensor
MGKRLSDPIVTQTDNRIDAEAAEWTARLDAAALDLAIQQQLHEWLEADPRRLGAFIRARARWADLDRLGALAAGRTQLPAEQSTFRWNRRSVLAAGLGGLTAGVLGWVALRPTTESYRTEVGEMRRVTLSDGSTLVLNTDSEVRIRFEAERRDVYLLRGEGLFEVAHDVQRPFIVLTESVRVRAVGTVFAVRLRGEEVKVTVSEGIVELARESQTAASLPPQRIAANQQSIVIPAMPSRVEEVTREAVRRRLAWLDGKVAFDGESLGEAVAEINRHSHRAIVIDDAQLSAQPIVGVFRATDAQGFCHAAAAALGAVVVEDGDTLHLRSRSD